MKLETILLDKLEECDRDIAEASLRCDTNHLMLKYGISREKAIFYHVVYVNLYSKGYNCSITE
jgi:hypothetical protein